MTLMRYQPIYPNEKDISHIRSIKHQNRLFYLDQIGKRIDSIREKLSLSHKEEKDRQDMFSFILEESRVKKQINEYKTWMVLCDQQIKQCKTRSEQSLVESKAKQDDDSFDNTYSSIYSIDQKLKYLKKTTDKKEWLTKMITDSFKLSYNKKLLRERQVYKAMLKNIEGPVILDVFDRGWEEIDDNTSALRDNKGEKEIITIESKEEFLDEYDITSASRDQGFSQPTARLGDSSSANISSVSNVNKGERKIEIESKMSSDVLPNEDEDDVVQIPNTPKSQSCPFSTSTGECECGMVINMDKILKKYPHHDPNDQRCKRCVSNSYIQCTNCLKEYIPVGNENEDLDLCEICVKYKTTGGVR